MIIEINYDTNDDLDIIDDVQLLMLCALRIRLDDVNDLDYIVDSDVHLNLVVFVVDVVHPAMLCALRAVLEACELLRLI